MNSVLYYIKRIFTLKWFLYNITVLFDLIKYYHPFKIHKNKRVPLHFKTKVSIVTIVFSVASLFMMFFPIIIVLQQVVLGKTLEPKLLIITAFGFVFTVFWRTIQQTLDLYIVYTGTELILIHHGFLEKKVDKIPQHELKGLFKLYNRYRNTDNYKVCLQLKNGKNVLLELHTNKAKAEKNIETYKAIFGLPIIKVNKEENPENNFINNYNYHGA